MAPRQQKPQVLLIEGRRVTVVHSTVTHWIEQLPSGRFVHHAGRIRTDQAPMKILDSPKPCSCCKAPAQTATPGGRAVHVTCEGWLDQLPDEVFGELVFGIAADLSASLLTATTPTKETRRAAA